MNNKWKVLPLAVVLTACLGREEIAQETRDSSQISHPYKVDTLITKPILFHPEVVSTQIDKYNTSFSADERTVFYTATSQKLGVTGIAFQTFENGRFGTPQFVPFVSADIPTTDVQIAPDGNLMLFSTFKDYESKPAGFNFNIWISELINGRWQEPKPLGSPIASSGNEFYPVMTDNKTLYFVSDKEGNSDIYYSRFEKGTYQRPVKLPEYINSDRLEADAFVSRDESILIFVRYDEEDGYGKSDLYISWKQDDSEWSVPVNMGETVNSNEVDGSPYITPDGDYLIFSSGRIENGLKEKAAKSYEEFKASLTSSKNGSLNFYIMTLDLDKYRS